MNLFLGVWQQQIMNGWSRFFYLSTISCRSNLNLFIIRYFLRWWNATNFHIHYKLLNFFYVFSLSYDLLHIFECLSLFFKCFILFFDPLGQSLHFCMSLSQCRWKLRSLEFELLLLPSQILSHRDKMLSFQSELVLSCLSLESFLICERSHFSAFPGEHLN